jgi:hypothetical protein
MERCKLREPVEMEIKDRYQVKISNRCRELEDFENNAAIDKGLEDVRENTTSMIGNSFTSARLEPNKCHP